MNDFFNREWFDFNVFKDEWIEWQDKNYQFITTHKSDKLNDPKLSQELKDRIIYEKIRFKCHHGGKPKEYKSKLRPDELGARNNTHSLACECPLPLLLLQKEKES